MDTADVLEQDDGARRTLLPEPRLAGRPAYYLLGLEIPLYTPIFVVSRITGWAAHVIEQLADNRLIRPLSHYTGPEQRPVLPLGRAR